MTCRLGRIASIVGFVLGVLGCGGDGGTVALFELPGTEGMGFYELPFPNDLRVDEDGTVAFADHPRPNQLVGQYLDAADDALVGFGLNPVAFFRFSDPLDPSSFPVDAASSMDPGASIFLVNVDAESPEYATRTPVRFRFEPTAGSVIGENWLAVQSFPGFSLQEGTTYAVVVTDAVQDAAGKRVRPSSTFADIIAGGGPASAQAAYEPLVSFLANEGIESDTIVSATVFTTQDVTSLLVGAREVIRSQPAPVATDVTMVNETAFYYRYEGTWTAPNFQSGTPPYQNTGGNIVVGADGLPVVQRMESLRFSLTVPTGSHGGNGWPVVLYAHGTGGDFRSYANNGIATELAMRGIASVSMDQVLHGPRGLGSDPSLSFFNFVNPLAARDNPVQGAIDLLNETYFIENLVIDDGDLMLVHEFDPSQIGFFGHSQGGLTGTPFLAVEPNARGAILSGAGGLVYMSLLLKTEPIDITAVAELLIRDTPLDEFNAVLALLQMYLDRGDGVNYARRIVRQPVGAAKPKHIYQSEGFIDNFTPPANIEALAVALGSNVVTPEIEPIEGMALAGRETLEAPVQGNVNGATSVLVQLNAVGASDGHFALFEDSGARIQALDFLEALVTTDAPTLNPR